MTNNKHTFSVLSPSFFESESTGLCLSLSRFYFLPFYFFLSFYSVKNIFMYILFFVSFLSRKEKKRGVTKINRLGYVTEEVAVTAPVQQRRTEMGQPGNIMWGLFNDVRWFPFARRLAFSPPWRGSLTAQRISDKGRA